MERREIKFQRQPPPDTWKNDLVQALNLLIRRLRTVPLRLWEKKKESSHSQMLDHRRGGVVSWPPVGIVPVAAFFLALIGGLDSSHFPGGAVLL